MSWFLFPDKFLTLSSLMCLFFIGRSYRGALHQFFSGYRLNDLEEFTAKTMKGLEKEPKENDYKALVEAMHLLNGVRERQVQTDAMFEPIKDTIDLLKIFGVDMSDKIYQQLEVSA